MTQTTPYAKAHLMHELTINTFKKLNSTIMSMSEEEILVYCQSLKYCPKEQLMMMDIVFEACATIDIDKNWEDIMPKAS